MKVLAKTSTIDLELRDKWLKRRNSPQDRPESFSDHESRYIGSCCTRRQQCQGSRVKELDPNQISKVPLVSAPGTNRSAGGDILVGVSLEMKVQQDPQPQSDPAYHESCDN